jgi:hypothetical protein
MIRPKLAFLAVMLFVLIANGAQAGQAMIKPEAVPAYQPKYLPFEGGRTSSLSGDLERHVFGGERRDSDNS